MLFRSPNQQVKVKILKEKEDLSGLHLYSCTILTLQPQKLCEPSHKLCEPSLCTLVCFLGQSVA